MRKAQASAAAGGADIVQLRIEAVIADLRRRHRREPHGLIEVAVRERREGAIGGALVLSQRLTRHDRDEHG